MFYGLEEKLEWSLYLARIRKRKSSNLFHGLNTKASYFIITMFCLIIILLFVFTGLLYVDFWLFSFIFRTSNSNPIPQNVLMLQFWPNIRRKREKQPNMGRSPSILRNVKFHFPSFWMTFSLKRLCLGYGLLLETFKP